MIQWRTNHKIITKYNKIIKTKKVTKNVPLVMQSTIRRLWVSGPHQPDADSDNLDKNYLSSQTLTSQGLIFNFSISQYSNGCNNDNTNFKSPYYSPWHRLVHNTPVTFGAIHVTYNETDYPHHTQEMFCQTHPTTKLKNF